MVSKVLDWNLTSVKLSSESKFFFFSVKSGSLNYHTIIKTYYRNDDSVTVAYRALRGDYGFHNRPTKQAIGKIVNKFEETGVVVSSFRSLR